MDKWGKYFSIFSLAFVHGLRNYKVLIGLSVFLMTCMVIFAHLWKIAATKVGAVSFSPEQLLWYIAFNEWVLVSVPDTQEEMEQDLRSGKLAYLLPRPISYLGATFAEALGTLSVNLLVLGFVTFLFTWWQVGVLPFYSVGFVTAIILGFIAGVVSILFRMLIGLSAFWLHEVSPIFWIWEKILFMMGGLMLPLTVYPEWMQMLANWTPFPAILGARSNLALDFNFQSVMNLCSLYMLWGAIGLFSLLFVYRKGMRILNIEGG